jgi:sulfate adenylyltransferase
VGKGLLVSSRAIKNTHTTNEAFMHLITPHGGTLIHRIRTPEELGINLAELPKLEINERSLSDLECIATGIYSPLTGFANSRDHASILKNMRLENGLPWSIPITLSHNTALSGKIVLTHQNNPVGLLEITETYTPDRQAEAQAVYRTTDPNHPGVAALLSQAPVNLAGDIWLFELHRGRFPASHFTPIQTRAKFAELGWRSVVAFQTRNPVHRAHEYLHKVALETIDGLFLNPLVGETKSDDVPASTRMAAYEVLLANYYPKDRVLLGVYPAAMRYAGPREAILHAISRKNYGCTHFIVGRDHAGVGSYYGTYDAQEIFNQYGLEEIGIQIIKFEHTFYCKKCGAVVSSRTCPHDKNEHLVLSGTKVRELLSAGAELPPEFSRPEVAQVLRAAYAVQP